MEFRSAVRAVGNGGDRAVQVAGRVEGSGSGGGDKAGPEAGRTEGSSGGGKADLQASHDSDDESASGLETGQ